MQIKHGLVPHSTEPAAGSRRAPRTSQGYTLRIEGMHARGAFSAGSPDRYRRAYQRYFGMPCWPCNFSRISASFNSHDFFWQTRPKSAGAESINPFEPLQEYSYLRQDEHVVWPQLQLRGNQLARLEVHSLVNTSAPDVRIKCSCEPERACRTSRTRSPPHREGSSTQMCPWASRFSWAA